MQAKLKRVTTRTEVLSAAKSKYVPVSVEEVIQSIKGGHIESSIIVCTPCQLKAIKNAMGMFKRDDSSVLYIGLFCERMFNYNVYGHYEKEYGKFDSLCFRDKEPNGWPGDTTLIQDGRRVKIDRRIRMSLKPLYPVGRCDCCDDKLNSEADISVGDCYASKWSHMDGGVGGVSNILIRTEKGRLAFESCREPFVVAECTLKDVEVGQAVYEYSFVEKAILKLKRYALAVVRRVVRR